jgi:hypothetical protein
MPAKLAVKRMQYVVLIVCEGYIPKSPLREGALGLSKNVPLSWFKDTPFSDDA